MLRQNRPVDNDFRPSDRLYRRCTQEDLDSTGAILPTRIKYDNVSVNWSRYSKPLDVVFDNPGEGIIRFLVKHLPVDLPKNPPLPPKPPKKPDPIKFYSFYPEHCPEDLNYSHSEIKTFKEGAIVAKPKLREIVKKELKQMMADRGLVILRPEI